MEADHSFEKSLKPVQIEEFLDYYFYRRLAHRLVPLLIRFKFKPNQISVLSMSVGLCGAALVYRWQFMAGALLAIAAIVLDCCDGQVARLTGLMSPIGRVMDGICDGVWIASMWLAIYHSGYFQSHGISIFPLMLAASILVFVHCWRFDGVKLNYLKIVRPDFSEKDLDFDSAFKLFKEELKKGHLLTAFFAASIAFQVYFFVSGTKKHATVDLLPAQLPLAREHLDPVIKLWPWIGEGHHNTLVILGLLLAPLTPYPLAMAFGIILGPMTLWQIYAEFRWQRALKAIKPLVS